MLTSTPTRPAIDAPSDGALKCVYSGYLTEECSCAATVPTHLVSEVWRRRQRERSPTHEDQFFTFTWEGGEWLAYGLRDGRVRGVYCPEHNARRTAHSCAQAADPAAR
jgi:hypothetical protein